MEITRSNEFYEPWNIGRMTARYMPADPQAWLDAATAADLHVSLHGDALHFAEGDISEDAIVFFKTWLGETPGAKDALKALLIAKGMTQRTFPI
ncbi:hypothetical protein ONR75_18475 [Rhodopseudomonas sp. P2A-2r]|uniref:hypothetical protein n=1 Tax=Rhodopseudomonas sp. P2A-2r TaxID=2991972 RepID=UPI00223499CC|nr:hypothetical protein [Rhodopseudomonas sp. P2A-2r]UZE46991.1 hypothetical protein ONR75_18475 [Rhodopseudomonas sp. P2A-2r]